MNSTDLVFTIRKKKLYDTFIVDEDKVPTDRVAYVSRATDKKSQENAKYWARGYNSKEGKDDSEFCDVVRTSGEGFTVEPIYTSYYNRVRAYGNCSCYWTCHVTKESDNIDCLLGIREDSILELIKSNAFKDGVAKDVVIYMEQNVRACVKNSDTYKRLLDMAKAERNVKKANKVDGAVFGSFHNSSVHQVYLGNYKPNMYMNIEYIRNFTEDDKKAGLDRGDRVITIKVKPNLKKSLILVLDRDRNDETKSLQESFNKTVDKLEENYLYSGLRSYTTFPKIMATEEKVSLGKNKEKVKEVIQKYTNVMLRSTGYYNANEYFNIANLNIGDEITDNTKRIIDALPEILSKYANYCNAKIVIVDKDKNELLRTVLVRERLNSNEEKDKAKKKNTDSYREIQKMLNKVLFNN